MRYCDILNGVAILSIKAVVAWAGPIYSDGLNPYYSFDGDEALTKSDCNEWPITADWPGSAFIGSTRCMERQLVEQVDEFYIINRTLTSGEIGALASVPEPSTQAAAASGSTRIVGLYLAETAVDL